MTDQGSPGHATYSNPKKSTQEPIHLLSPSPAMNQVIVSSRHPYVTDSSGRPSMRSTGGSSSGASRARHTTTGRSSMQMEPGLQALLVAEGRAAEMIANARAKRNDFLRQLQQQSQIEIEAFRHEREEHYKLKLHEATQLEQFQTKLDETRLDLFEQMEKKFRKERKSLIQYILHCVIDQIPIEAHRNSKRVLF